MAKTANTSLDKLIRIRLKHSCPPRGTDKPRGAEEAPGLPAQHGTDSRF
jgi:hypothetical protein